MPRQLMHGISDNWLRDYGAVKCMIFVHDPINFAPVLVRSGVDGAGGPVGFAAIALLGHGID